MRIKLILTVLLCLITGGISNITANNGGEGISGKVWAADPCQMWSDQITDNIEGAKRTAAHGDPTDGTMGAAIARYIDNLTFAIQHAAQCATNNGEPCAKCKEGQSKIQEFKKYLNERHGPLKDDVNDELVDILVNQAKVHPFSQRNFDMYLGHPVTRAISDAAGRKWVGQGYTEYIEKGKQLGWISADQLRVYRFPSFKVNKGIWQSNFERYAKPYIPGQRKKPTMDISNGHLTIE